VDIRGTNNDGVLAVLKEKVEALVREHAVPAA